MADSNQFIKDPSAILDYEFDWSEWLGSDTITTSTVTAASGMTVASSAATSTVVTAWLSGGTAGQEYAVTNRIVTAAGRTDERMITIRVMDR